jgi:hypothetical protein
MATSKPPAVIGVELYERYLKTLPAVPFKGRVMPYDWGQLPASLHFDWMAYGEMFREYSIEIANSLNQLTDYVHRLRAWDLALAGSDDDQKMEALHEFIDPISTTALNLPYAIRARFIFAVTHLCHQANKALPGQQWEDDLPNDKDIGFKQAEKYGDRWSAYDPCRDAFEKISKDGFETATSNFRNSYHHRFSPRVLLGISGLLRRRRGDSAKGAVQYAWGGTKPLQLKQIVDVLTAQCDRCYAAFDAFRELVREHEAAIAKHNAQVLAAI